jgi:hypothetical protein
MLQHPGEPEADLLGLVPPQGVLAGEEPFVAGADVGVPVGRLDGDLGGPISGQPLHELGDLALPAGQEHVIGVGVAPVEPGLAM